jgi:hypothetical protein
MHALIILLAVKSIVIEVDGDEDWASFWYADLIRSWSTHVAAIMNEADYAIVKIVSSDGFPVNIVGEEVVVDAAHEPCIPSMAHPVTLFIKSLVSE